MSERFPGGAAVPSGYYLEPSRWAVEPIARDGDRLPPGPGEWRRVPMLVALPLGPSLGVTFLMFMPAAGFIVVGQFLARKVGALLRGRGAADAPGPEQGQPPA